MKSLLTLLLTVFLLGAQPVLAAESSAPSDTGLAVDTSEAIRTGPGRRSFQTNSARTLGTHELETGLFGPTRFGLTDRLEIQSHPILFFLAPNARLRAQVLDQGNTHVALTLGLTYPTLLLRTLAMEGAGGVLPPDREVPHIISTFAEVSGTYERGDHGFTAGLGFQVAPRFGANELVSIDLPAVFPRTAAFFNTATLIPRIQAQGPIIGPLGYYVDARFFSSFGPNSTYSIEQSTRLRLHLSSRWLLQGGVMVTHGDYPFGSATRLLPLADLLWVIR